MALSMQQTVGRNNISAATSSRCAARSLRPRSVLRTTRFVLRAEPTETSSPPEVEPQVAEPKTKSSWELIEAPVRGRAPDGGPPVSERNNMFDDLLIQNDGADERALTGLPVAFPDAFRFKGAAPEIINCRLAMLGAFAGLTAELTSGKSIIEQYRMAPGPIAAVFLLFIVASLIPISKGLARKGAADFGSPFGFLTSELEVNVGRVAMLGIAGTILTEAIIGHAVL